MSRPLLREPFSGASHLVGAVLSLIAVGALIVQAGEDSTKRIVGGIYGITLIGLYLASGLYHSLYLSEGGIRRMRKADHAAIYLLISGTYVPICLLGLDRPLGPILVGVQAGLAAVGVVAAVVFGGGPGWLRTLLYVAMGWMAIGFLGPLGEGLPPGGLAWLLAGGAAYTVGAVFYVLDRPKLVPGKFGAHDLWHLFVMAGSACHFVVVWGLVARR